MESKYPIEDQINRTLESLDTVQPADPGDFFYGRLMNRISEQRKSQAMRLKWALAYAMIAAIAFINVYTLLRDQPEESFNTGVEWLTEEYGYPVSMYDIMEE